MKSHIEPETIKTREADERVQLLLDSSPLVAHFWDENFNIVDCNQAAVTLFGLSSKQEYIERYFELTPEFQPDGSRSKDRLKQLIKKTFKEGTLKTEWMRCKLDGELIPVEVTFVRVQYKDRNLVAAYCRDLRDHKRMMEDIEKRGKILYTTNRVAEVLLAAADEENFEKSLLEALQLLGLCLDADCVQLWSNEMIDDTLHFALKYKWLSEAGKKAPDVPIGTPVPYPSRWLDVFSRDECINGPIAELPQVDRELLGPLGLTSTITVPLYYQCKFWGVFCVDDCIKERYFTEDEIGILRSAALMLLNAINRNLQLKALTDAQEEAEAASQAKSAFLRTMSHEIRTPMNAILGITEMQFQKEMLDKDVRDGLERIYTSGDMLLGIINDVLDLSKIEAGKLELVISKYETASLISDTAQLNMMRIGSKPINFELHIEEGLPVTLYGDELRIKQILNNMLSNAIKYTSEGTVKMSVSSKPVENNNANINVNVDDSIVGISDEKTMLTVSVSDTGQGMSKEQVDKLFDEYSRFNLEANRTTEGTGLGMSITHNLIHMMDGEISIESEPGVGSTFTVFIPQTKTDSAVLGSEMVDTLHNFRSSSRAQMRRTQVIHEPMPYGRVLIVDDVDSNIYVARGLLTPYELNIDTVTSGFAAIEKIKQGREYDVVFMDHMMPEMDGVETVKIIRDLGYAHPIVALTANAVAGQADVFLKNGFDDFMSKPIDVRQLNSVLNRLIRDKQPPEIIEAAKRLSGFNKKTQDPADSLPQGIDPQLLELFLQDANKAIDVLDSIIEKGSPYSAEDMRMYIIYTHGVKNALANVNKTDLSATALKLEQLGRDNNIESIAAETPSFLIALKDFVNKVTPPMEEENAEEPTSENEQLLREKLQEIKAACEDWDKSKARESLAALRKETWSKQTRELLDKINEQLLHSDFDEIEVEIDKFSEGLGT